MAPEGPYLSGAVRTLLPGSWIWAYKSRAWHLRLRIYFPSKFALETRGVGATGRRKDGLLGGEWKDPEKSPVPWLAVLESPSLG